MPLTIIIALLAVHFLADFVFQSHWMASQKSTNWLALLVHVLVYGSCFLIFGWQFAVVNAALHFVVDAVTSRLTKRLWAANQIHWFFVVIGFDQLMHYICLLQTYNWLNNGIN